MRKKQRKGRTPLFLPCLIYYVRKEILKTNDNRRRTQVKVLLRDQ